MIYMTYVQQSYHFGYFFFNPHASQRTCDLPGRSWAVPPFERSPPVSFQRDDLRRHHETTSRFHFQQPIPCWREYQRPSMVSHKPVLPSMKRTNHPHAMARCTGRSYDTSVADLFAKFALRM